MDPLGPEVMLVFYQRLFPFQHLYHWLNHHMKETTDFGYREFAFTLQNDAYLRYQSFFNAEALRPLRFPTCQTRYANVTTVFVRKS